MWHAQHGSLLPDMLHHGSPKTHPYTGQRPHITGHGHTKALYLKEVTTMKISGFYWVRLDL